MSQAPEILPPNFSMAELLVHALVVELEAVQSYKDLAAQMEQCGNKEVAELFQKMAVLEAEHAETIRQKSGDIELPELAPGSIAGPALNRRKPLTWRVFTI